ncbi:apoptosis antagonizing transcription factor-domain-containing protein [Blastocladiella britannica]|nr:apoptosis antagonizing transcription factor-domain-containing protein [Blastocladiella britannica]
MKSKSKASSLAATLAALNSPRPTDDDPESLEWRDSNMTNGSDADDDNDKDERDRSHYLDMGKSTLRAQVDSHLLEGPRYQGKRVSRKDLEAAWSDSDEENAADSDDSDNAEDAMDVDDSDVQSDDREGLGFKWGAAADSDDDADARGSDWEPESFGDAQESDDAEEASGSEEEENGRDGNSSDEGDALTRKILAAAANDADPATTDSEKGQHIRAQMAITDALLDLRIRLQKAVAAANMAPNPTEIPDFVAASTDGAVARELAATQAALASLAYDLATVHRTMADTHPALSEVVIATVPELGRRKRARPADLHDADTLSELWADEREFSARTKPWRMDALDKWHDKVNATAGLQLNAAKKFKAINASFTTQVASLMSDRDRLLSRTRLKRFNEPILSLVVAEGDVEATTAGETQSGREKELVDEYDEAAEHRGSARTLRNSSYDYIYDDSDFYASQLKDLIDRKLADAPAAQAAHHAALRASRIKRKVDTRASKGRALRFHVHDKIANYMAASPIVPQYAPANVPGSAIVGGGGGAVSNVDDDAAASVSGGGQGASDGGRVASKVVPWTDSMKDELFGSLFGVQDDRSKAEAEARTRSAAAELQHQQGLAANAGALRLFG